LLTFVGWFRVKPISWLVSFGARCATKEPRRLLAPLAPLFRDLERDAEAVLSGWKE
jgi:hypothetical protein